MKIGKRRPDHGAADGVDDEGADDPDRESHEIRQPGEWREEDRHLRGVDGKVANLVLGDETIGSREVCFVAVEILGRAIQRDASIM